jgi:microcompartment protein CcmK/EutM
LNENGFDTRLITTETPVMLLAKIVGTVTLGRAHPALSGARLRCVEALESLDQLSDTAWGGTDLHVAWDDLGSAEGDIIAMAEGPEAALPLRPRLVPLDAYAAAIIDHLDIPPSATETR